MIETPDTTESSSDEEIKRIGQNNSGNNGEEGDRENRDESSSSDDDDEEEMENAEAINELDPGSREIQVEFEARTPEACDYHGILRLLKKYFGPNTCVNLSTLADYIINQRNVGSVVTQSRANEDDDDDEEDETFEGLDNEVYGLLTVIRLDKSQPLAKSIIDHVVTNTKKSGDCIAKVADLFNKPGVSIGFVISERIINIPPQISVPLYESLYAEIAKAKAKNYPFDFTHYMILSRMLFSNNPGESSFNAGPNVIHVNAEEEVITEEADLVVETEIPAEQILKAYDINGKGEYDGQTKIMVFNGAKVESVILPKIKNAFPL